MTRQPFTCHDCGDTFQPTDDTCATGYAVIDDGRQQPNDGRNWKICYECARKRDLADAAETGKLFAYVTAHPYRRLAMRIQHIDIDAVTTWPGLQLNVGPINTHNTWRSNFGDVRTAFTCLMMTGLNGAHEVWHGIAYAGNGGYCRLRRAKVQS